MTDEDTRTAYTAGLRTLADLLDANPELPLPFSGSNGDIMFIEAGSPEEELELARLFTRLMPGPVTKGHRDDFLDLDARIDGLRVSMIVNRKSVCTRRVVGTRTIEVPDPDAPKVTQIVEDVEWDCHPLLADREAVQS